MTTSTTVREQLAAVLDGEYGSDAALVDALLAVVTDAQAAAIRDAARSLCRGEDEFPAIHSARCVSLLTYADDLVPHRRAAA